MKKNSKAIMYRPRLSAFRELEVKATLSDWVLAFIGSSGMILFMWAIALKK